MQKGCWKRPREDLTELSDAQYFDCSICCTGDEETLLSKLAAYEIVFYGTAGEQKLCGNCIE